MARSSKPRFEILPVDEAVWKTGLPLDELVTRQDVQRLVRIVDGRREEAVLLPVLDEAAAAELRLVEEVVEAVRTRGVCLKADLRSGFPEFSDHRLNKLLAKAKEAGQIVPCRDARGLPAWQVAEAGS